MPCETAKLLLSGALQKLMSPVLADSARAFRGLIWVRGLGVEKHWFRGIHVNTASHTELDDCKSYLIVTWHIFQCVRFFCLLFENPCVPDTHEVAWKNSCLRVLYVTIFQIHIDCYATKTNAMKKTWRSMDSHFCRAASCS